MKMNDNDNSLTMTCMVNNKHTPNTMIATASDIITTTSMPTTIQNTEPPLVDG